MLAPVAQTQFGTYGEYDWSGDYKKLAKAGKNSPDIALGVATLEGYLKDHPYFGALIAVALFSAAYMAEVVRGGLQALPKGQYEAADSLGLSYGQKTMFIILPQALRITDHRLRQTRRGSDRILRRRTVLERTGFSASIACAWTQAG